LRETTMRDKRMDGVQIDGRIFSAIAAGLDDGRRAVMAKRDADGLGSVLATARAAWGAEAAARDALRAAEIEPDFATGYYGAYELAAGETVDQLAKSALSVLVAGIGEPSARWAARSVVIDRVVDVAAACAALEGKVLRRLPSCDGDTFAEMVRTLRESERASGERGWLRVALAEAGDLDADGAIVGYVIMKRTDVSVN
jgi:hypothetical protein